MSAHPEFTDEPESEEGLEREPAFPPGITRLSPRPSPFAAPPPPVHAPLPGLATHEQEPDVVQERTAERLSELMRALVRTLKAKKMYPANNPVLQRILGEFQDAMMGLLEEIEDFSLTVTADELLFGEYSVYQNVSKRDGLAHRFHRDGITEIGIQNGLTLPELNGFLDVLGRATEQQGAEEDLVTLLWEQEFSHIRYAYIAIEDMQEGLLDSDPLAAQGSPEDREVPWPHAESEADTLVIEAEEGDEGSGERSDDWAQLVPAQDVVERCPAHLLELSRQELQDLAEEVHLEHSRPLTDIALEILTEVAQDERNSDRFADLARALSELAVLAIADADFAHATQVLSTLRTLSTERQLDAAAFLPDAEELIRQATASLRHSPDADSSSLPEFFAHLGPGAVDPVCDLLHEREFEHLQPILASGLALLAAQNLSHMQKRLETATGTAARHILAAVTSSPYPEANKIIACAIAHREPRVRRDAIRALVERKAIATPEAQPYLARALQDLDPQVRGAALLALQGNPSERMGAPLLTIIEGSVFRSLTPTERQAYLDTLLRVPGETPRALLREWATRPIWWPNKDRAERRALAARALARAGHPLDREVLERHARSIFPGVRGACRAALAEMTSLLTPARPAGAREKQP
jgi:hypothetical protein